MPRYKRLNVEYWQTEVWLGRFGEPVPWTEISTTLRAVDPVFHREGWYLFVDGRNRFSWFENGTGAWTTDDLVEDFTMELGIASHVPLSTEQRRAIFTLIQHKLAPKQLRELYSMDLYWHQLKGLSAGREYRLDRFTQRITFDKPRYIL